MGVLKKNLAYQTLYQVLLILLPLITAPYIARVLGTENSGIYSFCNTVAVYFVTFGNLGIEQYGNRTIARARDDKNELSKAFSELFFLHALTSIAAIVCYTIYYLFVASKYKSIVLIEGIYVVSVLFDVNWFFCGIEQFKLTVTRSAVIKAISVLSIFLFVKSQEDLPVYSLIMASSVFASNIVIWPQLKTYVSFRKVGFADMCKHLYPMVLLFVAVIAAHLNRVIDKTMLGIFGYINELGCYDYADRIIRMPLGLIAALGTVMLSKMSYLYATRDKQIQTVLELSSITVLIASFAFAFGIIAVAPEFIQIYLGDEFSETAVLLCILSISVPFVGWNNFIRTQVLIPTQKDKIYTNAILIGAGVNILLNLVLIKLIKARGAAVATVISYSLITLFQTIPVKSELNTRKVRELIPVLLIIGGTMLGVVRLVALININCIVRIFLEVIIGAFIYIGLITIYFLHKDKDFLKMIIRRM